MVHNNVSLTVSQDEAARADDEAKRRLLANKKLSLVVDLDQTIIHATVDPTVADWQKDLGNPNHDAVKDVRSFLLDDDARDKPGCWYYIKLRPNLSEFLESVSKMYELHIYTMGTRAYAKNIADIIDPEHKIFGDRILSRTESGNMTAKNLQRLFPVDTKMVVIIDDRGDVWKWSPNLIKVTPYDFFVGIGDINSSFLPKKPGPRPSSKATVTAPPRTNGDLAERVIGVEAEIISNGTADQQVEAPSVEGLENPIVSNASPLAQLVAMGESDDLSTREAQTSSQKETVDKQVEERPLLQKQKQLEAEDAATESAAAAKEDGDPANSSHTTDESSDSDKPKHNLLQDNDLELVQLEESLRSVHTEFYKLYNQSLAAASGGRLAQLLGEQKRTALSSTSDLDLVPDIKEVLPSVKAKVLGGVVIVFSGVVPLGMDVQSTDIAILAGSFGAKVHEDISRHTTHLVAARNRTTKVSNAKKRRIAIVTPQWLTDSVASWSRKDEARYLLDGEEGAKVGQNYEDILSESDESIADDEDDETDNTTGRDTPKPGLTIDTNPPSSEAGDTEPDIDYDDIDTSPVGGTNDDWDDMSKEINDFLGSDEEDGSDMDPYADDDGDRDSILSEDSILSSKISVRGRKRGRDEIDSGGESDEVKGKVKKTKQALVNGLTSLSQTTNAEASEDEGVNGNANGAGADHDPVDGGGANGKAEEEEDAEEEAEEEEDDGWGDEMAKEFEEEMRRAQQSEEQGEG